MFVELRKMFVELRKMFVELKACIKECLEPCNKKWFWHNLSCELRHGRYKCCYDYKDRWRTRFLFSLGVLVMDFWGMRYKFYLSRFKTKLDMRTLDQWLVHPFPWVRYMCRRDIKKFSERRNKKEEIKIQRKVIEKIK